MHWFWLIARFVALQLDTDVLNPQRVLQLPDIADIGRRLAVVMELAADVQHDSMFDAPGIVMQVGSVLEIGNTVTFMIMNCSCKLQLHALTMAIADVSYDKAGMWNARKRKLMVGL